MITQKRLKELFDYKDGLLYRKSGKGGVEKGCVAGYSRKNGYREVSVLGKKYYNHRLVYLYHYGYMPEGEVDHINRVPGDDRIENLREVSRYCNMRNINNTSANTSSVKGVHYNKINRTWVAQIRANNKTSHIGASKSFIEAVCLRLAAEQCLGWGKCGCISPAFSYIVNPRGRLNKADRDNLTLGV